MTEPLPATVELYANPPGGARWGEALWGVDTWATAGWQDVTPLSVTGTISWGVRNPELGMLAMPDADTWGLTLHDPDRLLDPGNPNAAYYGDLKAGLPIRISHRGVVVRTGIVESIGHHFANHGGYIRATSVQARMVKADVPVGSAPLPDTLYARARAAIAVAGLNILVYGLGKPGLWDDPPLMPLVLTQDRSVWAIITEAALGCLQMPYIDRFGSLRFRAWDNILDRGTTLTTAEMVDLSAISTDTGLYSKVEVLEAAGTNYQTRATTPPPDYGIVTYRRSVPTVDAGNWAARVLADRTDAGIRWIPGDIHTDDAERLEHLLITDMLERVVIDADTPLAGAMVVVGGEVTVSGGTTNKGRWGVNFKGKHTQLGPALGGVAAIQITNTTAVISWITSTPSSSRVNYGLTSAYGSSSTLDATLVTQHSQTLTGLTPSTPYHYRVRSVDANGLELISADYTFTTIASGTDTTAPTVLTLTATVVSSTGAQIAWTLSETATGQVEYGPTTGLGSVTPAETSFVYSSHSQSIDNLTAGTWYYRVVGADASGNAYTSATQSFTFGTVPVIGYPLDRASLTYVARPAIPAVPAYLTPVNDPTWGTKVIRVSNVDDRRHVYSRLPAWNSDQSRLLLGFSSTKAMLNGTDYSTIRTFSSLVGNAVWANTDPNKCYGAYSGDNHLYVQNMTTDAQTAIHTFTGYTEVSLGGGEGGISDDDKYIALITKTAGNVYGAIVYRIDTDTIIGEVSFGTTTSPDNLQISRKGNWMGVEWNVDGTGTNQGFVLYNQSLTQVRNINQYTTHWDMGLDINGNEIAVQIGNGVVAYNCASLAGTQLLPSNTAMSSGHVSCKNIDRPGWAYLSSYNYSGTVGLPGNSQLIGVKTDGSGIVEVFAFDNHAGNGADYNAQPQMCVSRDGKRVIWAGDWGTTTGPTYAYVAGLNV